jgi:hypothetical protein
MNKMNKQLIFHLRFSFLNAFIIIYRYNVKKSNKILC